VVNVLPVFESAFSGPEDDFDGRGVRPVVFDILSPDRQQSLLPAGLKVVLHVNPKSMSFSYAKVIERIQTKGGFVEQHWGRAAVEISFEMATGGFMRLHTGLVSLTGGGLDVGGTRRDTIAYDKYLDLLATFKNNGAIYDLNGSLILQGIIKCSFDGAHYFGWFTSFSVSEEAATPYSFNLSASFTVDRETMGLRTTISQSAVSSATGRDFQEEATALVEGFGSDAADAVSNTASKVFGGSPKEVPPGKDGFE
jgi:hypothetical protein